MIVGVVASVAAGFCVAVSAVALLVGAANGVDAAVEVPFALNCCIALTMPLTVNVTGEAAAVGSVVKLALVPLLLVGAAV